MIYKILTGCYIVAALVLVAACNDGLDKIGRAHV